MSQDPTPTEEILELGRKIASLQCELSRARLRSAIKAVNTIPASQLIWYHRGCNDIRMIREMIESPHYNHDTVSVALDDLESIIDRTAK